MRDKDLRSAKVFDTASHPDITYTVDGMQPASDGARVTGSLTVRGRTRPPLSTRQSPPPQAKYGWTPKSRSTGPTSA